MGGALLLLLTALIWGGSFVAQKLGMDHVGPFAFTFYSDALAGVFLFALVRGRARMRGAKPVWSRTDVVGGAWSGFWLWGGMMLQQIGIQWTTPGVSAFLTANYVLVVPLLGLFLGRTPKAFVWPGVALALAGAWFLCVPAESASAGQAAKTFLGLPLGELLSAACALVFGAQIVVVERFVSRPDADALQLTCVSFFAGAILCAPFLQLPTEKPLLTYSNIWSAMGAIAFCGFLSSGLACTFQNVGLKLVAPAVAAILLSLESVFAAIMGALFLGESLSGRQLLGCACVFVAAVFVQVCDAMAASPSRQTGA